MEVGLFFMPKIHQPIKAVSKKQRERGGSFAHKNYNMTKDKKTHPERMETKKYCRFCKKHTNHKETK